MHYAVLAFLTDKMTNIVTQTLIGYLILEVTNRLDKKSLTLGEMHRERIKKAGKNRITTVPVAENRRNIKNNLSRLDRCHIHRSLHGRIRARKEALADLSSDTILGQPTKCQSRQITVCRISI